MSTDNPNQLPIVPLENIILQPNSESFPQILAVPKVSELSPKIPSPRTPPIPKPSPRTPPIPKPSPPITKPSPQIPSISIPKSSPQIPPIPKSSPQIPSIPKPSPQIPSIPKPSPQISSKPSPQIPSIPKPSPQTPSIPKPSPRIPSIPKPSPQISLVPIPKPRTSPIPIPKPRTSSIPIPKPSPQKPPIPNLSISSKVVMTIPTSSQNVPKLQQSVRLPTVPIQSKALQTVPVIGAESKTMSTQMPKISIPSIPGKTMRLNIIQKETTTEKSLDEVIEMGRKRLSEYQNEILEESLEKGSGALSLPMGTGKTLLSILLTLIQCKELEGEVLAVVSKSLITTWVEEINKFFGTALKYEVLHTESMKTFNNWIPTGNIILTTPEVISKIYRRYEIGNKFSYTERPERFGPETRFYNAPNNPYLNHTHGEGILYSRRWGALIVDEAHNYFNPKSARCMALSSVCATHRWLLSGTLLAEPKPEKLFGYHLMMNHPEAPRNLPGFKVYIKSENYGGLSHTLVKREGNADFIPPKINKVIVSHPLSETEAAIYSNMKSLLNVLKERLKEYKLNGDRVNTKKFSSYIMGMIAHMRQCLVCPLIPITTVAIDVADLEHRSEFSKMFMDYISKLNLNSWLNDINSLYSSRINSVCNVTDKHKENRIIIFSCFRTVLNVIRLYLPKDREIFTFEGNHKIDTRSRIIDDFRKSSNGILLLTYDIGANGLNLQCASAALLVDFWWNAGKSEQAVARLLRPGQSADTVDLYYFTANSGMENALFKLQTAKLAMGEEILTGSMTTTTQKINVNEIIRLIDLEDNIEILDDILS